MPTFSWKPPFVSVNPEPELAASSLDKNTPAEVVDLLKHTLPDFVLKYAPILYISKTEKYFPGNPVDHITHLTPRGLDGRAVPVPEECKGKVAMLSLPQVNRTDVFLTMDNVRKDPTMAPLLSDVGKPSAEGRSTSPTFILFMDKSATEGGSGTTIDAFYFFFYPFNLGNKVVFKNWGNHVGDWEHSMIRFKDGVPQFIHLSAHSDGNAWQWSVISKKDERPIIYCASGSHANYPTAGSHAYSPVPLLGPKDYTSAGFPLDPTLHFVCAEVQADITFKYAQSSHPGHNRAISDTDLITMLSFQGRWGNSFSDLRQARVFPFFFKRRSKKVVDAEDKLTHPADQTLLHAETSVVSGDAISIILAAKAEGNSLTLYQRLLLLIWAEGPTGPRDKSLDRKGMNRWEDRAVLTSL